MKMVLVLVLFGVLAVSADDFHDDLNFIGCSATDGEVMYSLNDEELWYADFEKGEGVDAQPDFVDPKVDFTGLFPSAQANLRFCRSNLEVFNQIFIGELLERDPPSTPIVYHKHKVEQGVKNSLVCYVTGFFPAPVGVSWEKNGESVTEGISTNVPIFSREGTFSQFSRLEFIPQPGDTYSCSVSHVALKEPLTSMYEVNLPGPDVVPDVLLGVGVAVLVLGMAAGTALLMKGNKCF